MKAGIALIALLPLGLGPAHAAPPRSSSAQDRDYRVERVVLVMRHGVRPSTKFPATKPGTTSQPWAPWTTAAGQLTERGAAAVRLLAAADTRAFRDWGLLPATACAPAGIVSAKASATPRAIDTGRAYLEVMQPDCGTPMSHPADDAQDAIFHPLDGALRLDGAAALRSAEAALPRGGIAAEVARQDAAFRVLDRILGVPVDRRSMLTVGETGQPELDGGLSFGSTAGQTILLQYLEGMPLASVGWGRASPADIRTILNLHTVKARLEDRPAYVAERAGAPLAREILAGLRAPTPRVTLLFGHDSNLGAVAGFYRLNWTMADYPADDIAPGGAVGFQLLRDRSGRRFVRAFVRAQSMEQVRELTPLVGKSAPRWSWLSIPGCPAVACPLATFERLTKRRLTASPDGALAAPVKRMDPR